MKIYLNEPMDVDLFIRLWREELNKLPLDAFTVNMKTLGVKPKTYSEWISTWVAWNELSSDEDIDNYYGGDAFLEIEE
jgi:hypothetical protein